MTSILPFSRRPCAMTQAMTLTLNRLLAGVSETARQPDERFAGAFSELVFSVECAFRQEEDLAEATGYAGLRQLRQTNALLLRALHRVAAQVDSGAVAPGREVIAALPELLARQRLGVPGQLAPRQRTRQAS